MIRLDCGSLSAVVAPETGGAMLGWTEAGRSLLRGIAPDALLRGAVRGFAGFPLLPFCNRIADARFEWAGRNFHLARNFGDEPHAIHGVGWQSVWQPGSIGADAVSLHLYHVARGEAATHWPFSFEADLSYRLSAGALTVALAVTNRHSGPAPAGLGLHPYFPRSGAPVLRFAAKGVWLTEGSLPSRHVPVPPAWDHTAGLTVGAVALDHCFTDWTGTARIDGIAGGGLVITADGVFRHLQVFTPVGRDFFAVEPVTHVPDAINRPGLSAGQAMQVLNPGEALAGSVTFRLLSG